MTCDPDVSDSAGAQRYAERLRLQRDIDQAILRAQLVDQTADAVLAGLRRLVACLRASVLLLDHDADQIEVLAPSPRVPPLHIMPDRVRQVFLNVILNAIDPPAGCRFHPRCFAKVGPICEQQQPPVFVVGEQRVACWLHERQGFREG